MNLWISEWMSKKMRPAWDMLVLSIAAVIWLVSLAKGVEEAIRGQNVITQWPTYWDIKKRSQCLHHFYRSLSIENTRYKITQWMYCKVKFILNDRHNSDWTEYIYIYINYHWLKSLFWSKLVGGGTFLIVQTNWILELITKPKTQSLKCQQFPEDVITCTMILSAIIAVTTGDLFNWRGSCHANLIQLLK